MTRAMHFVVQLEEGEGKTVAAAFGSFFCIMASYYLLLPLRDEVGLVIGKWSEAGWKLEWTV